MRRRFPALVIAALGVAGCSRSSASSGSDGSAAEAAPAPAVAAPKHFGDIMAEVGRRFERIGRAAKVGRWDLAAYDLGEIEEVFADIPHAIMPDDVHVDLRPLAADFASKGPPDLKQAIASHDPAAFQAAFARTAARCNACHETAGRAFIQVPTEMGAAVPRLDAPAAPAAP
jgi:hypothetical protein